jgi:hypothetical protein
LRGIREDLFEESSGPPGWAAVRRVLLLRAVVSRWFLRCEELATSLEGLPSRRSLRDLLRTSASSHLNHRRVAAAPMVEVRLRSNRLEAW